MIPRAARKLETTLLPYSRQCLPRPARLYSAPSKRADAPALATAPSPSPTYPAYMPSHTQEKADVSLTDMQAFLRRPKPYTILPTPLPDDTSSSLNNLYFIDSPTQDLLAVMNACLHNLYDVPRAKNIFDRLRLSKAGDPIMEPRLYSSILEAYVGMASKGSEDQKYWLGEALSLYDAMESGREKVIPAAGAYSTMLLVWLRFNPESSTAVEEVNLPSPIELLGHVIDRGIKVSEVVSDKSISSSDEAAQIIKLLSKAAVDLKISRIVSELGEAEAVGTRYDFHENIPEVMPVTRRKVKETDGTQLEDGSELAAEELGEEEVPFNLDVLRKHLANVILTRRVLSEDAASRQKHLEESAYSAAEDRLKRQAETFKDLGISNLGLNRHGLQAWMWDWHQKLQARLKTDIAAYVKMEQKTIRPLDRRYTATSEHLGPFLTLVKEEKLSLITILELMRLNGSGGLTDGMKTARALLQVGRTVEMEYKAEICKKNQISIPTHVTRPYEGGYFTGFSYKDLHARRVIARKYMDDAEDWTTEWTQTLRIKVGSFLVDRLMDVATVQRRMVDKSGKEIFEDQEAFFHAYEYLRGHKLGIIKLNPMVSERLSRDEVGESLHPRHLPMLIKPKPWVSHDQGGYLFNKSSAMRFKDSREQQSYLQRASDRGDLEYVYAGLDVLGATPWQINRGVFDVVLEVWNSGQPLGKIPPAQFDQPPPAKPDNFTSDPKARNVYMQRLRAYHHDKANNHSDRCSVNYRMEIARTFLGDTFYLPHNIDFRGRAYPIPPHLNHIGDDLSRGLLKFGESRPLGERGLRWLKVHLANLYGYDKGNFDDRVVFVDEHLDDIYDSAEKPLEGRRWWTKADDPWQCLATCMELRAALESDDPLAYESALPVHQDGTCNGLQHYAALGGDEQGAKQVNLDVTERPSDVYTYVANTVDQAIQKDAADNKYAAMLQGKISRKVVKQTVMTTVYGVTFVGARDQIERQLKDKGEIPEEECWGASSYLAKKVIAAIADLFGGAKDIQLWLNLSARLITKSIPPDRVAQAISNDAKPGKKQAVSRMRKEQMTSMVWTTPLRLPIVQPYRKQKRKQIMTSLQTVYISDPNVPSEVNSLKQASAFPPNFIHSLDASHMMLTALECTSHNIMFASVHDSYWTHASTVDQMSSIIRDTFIALHSSEILPKLHEEFRERYKDYKVPFLSIRTSVSLVKRLKALGVRVPEASDFLNVPKGEPLLEELEKEFASEKAEDEDLEASDDISTEATDVPSGKKASPREKAKAKIYLKNVFVDLMDLLPPVPQKGTFDVSTIKKSLYFFS